MPFKDLISAVNLFLWLTYRYERKLGSNLFFVFIGLLSFKFCLLYCCLFGLLNNVYIC